MSSSLRLWIVKATMRTVITRMINAGMQAARRLHYYITISHERKPGLFSSEKAWEYLKA